MDGTWEEAYWACLQRGGHLVTFDDQAEFDYVSQDLLDHNKTYSIHSLQFQAYHL